VELPDPARAASPPELVERLRLLKVWAGDPSYEKIKNRVNAAWTAAGRPAGELTIRSTVAHCFQPGRRRLNHDLVIAVVEALQPDPAYVGRWRQALRAVGGEIEAVAQVRVQDALPPGPPSFTGRTAELAQLTAATGVFVLEGMAGAGKTQLAVHAGHRLGPFGHVLFVNLRGFHPDPAQPPADPGAVLDGFLRLLGVPGHRIPHDLTGRAALYRERLTGANALVVLDNAATAEQVEPLLPPAGRTLVTTRHSLNLTGATHVHVGVFTPPEAAAFLTGTAGDDPGAVARIAHRCGYLPLALSLVAGHIRNTPGWTLTDHADRLDERHDRQRLDTGVELALDLSYQGLSPDRQRLLRLAALHPGPDLDAYAVAALAGVEPAAARAGLADLCRDHLLEPSAPGRFAFHDLVRVHAAGHAHDQDSPPERRAALARLFDHYLATAASAMNSLHPGVAHHRPPITPAAPFADPAAAAAWLDTERPALAAMAAHGSPRHVVLLSHLLFRYLDSGDQTDALVIHGHAERAARDSGDTAGLAHALSGLGWTYSRLGRIAVAADHLRRAVDLFGRVDDPAGRVCAVHSLGNVLPRLGLIDEGLGHLREALLLHRRFGDRINEASALNALGGTMLRAGRPAEAIEHFGQALALARATGNRQSETWAVHGIAEAELAAGRYGPARDGLEKALGWYRELGERQGEAGVLDGLGQVHEALGQAPEAVDCYRQALAIYREVGDQDGEKVVLNRIALPSTSNV
jgi:tetratricopeptide (TPR) repeat protein